MSTLDAALALFSMASIAATYVWQSGRTERQRLAIEWEREKFKASQLAEALRWEAADNARKADAAALKTEFEKLQTEFNTIKARLEGGRVELKRTA